MFRLFGLTAACVMAASGALATSLVTYDWTGRVLLDELPGGQQRQTGIFDYGISNFDTITGKLTFDEDFPEVAGISGGDPDRRYGRGVMASMEFTLGGLTVFWEAADDPNVATEHGATINVDNSSDLPAFGSQFRATVLDADQTEFGMQDRSFDEAYGRTADILVNGSAEPRGYAFADFQISSSQENLFNPDETVPSFDLAQFEQAFAYINVAAVVGGAVGLSSNEIAFRVLLDSMRLENDPLPPPPPLPPVPLPASGLLAGFGLMALAGLRRTRRKG